MKKPKTLIAFIILILMIAGFAVIASSTKIFSHMEFSAQQGLKVSGIADTIKRVDDQIALMDSEFTMEAESSAELMAYALGSFVTEDAYEGPEVFDNGIVIRIENDTIVYPETAGVRFPDLNDGGDLDEMPPLTDTTISANEEERTVLLTVKRITDGLYYLEWTDQEDYRAFVNEKQFLEEAISFLEKSYDSGLLLTADGEKGPTILYHSEEFGTMETLEDIGLSKEILTSEPAEITIGEITYSADYANLTFLGRPVKAVVLSPQASDNTNISNCIFIAAGWILLCMTGLILWIGWVEDYVRDHTLTESQEKAYHPSKIRKTATAIGVNGAILLLAILIGYQLIANLSRTSAGNQAMLDIIMGRLENENKQDALFKDEIETREIQKAKRIAALYGTYPELRTREFLSKAAEMIGCEFVMIFDGNGKELMSSNAYVGFTLGKEISSTEDFRLLLQGVDQIIHDPEVDRYTGKTIQLAGIRIDTGNEKSYEAMILAFDLEKSREYTEKQEIAGYISMLTPRGYLSLVINQENDRIAYSSEPDFVGCTPWEIGLSETDLIPTSLEPFEILKQKTYGAFNENERYRFYYIMDAGKIWGNTVIYAAIATLVYMFICLVISLIMLGPSHSEIYRQSSLEKKKRRHHPALQLDKESIEKMGRDFLEKYQKEDIGDRSLKEWWRDLTPENKILRIMSLLVTVIMVVILTILGTREGTGSVIGFILRGNWKHGVNDLALLSIFCVLFILAAFILLKGLLLWLLCTILDAKGETIARLVSSLLQYISIITAICFCLSYLGFDTGTLITSAGILTLAISLGSKDLVADILSGIFIIFEGDFQVGDIIEVNGFKGRVLDIGVRSTKLKDSSQNIKIIDNQSVKNVLNLSKDYSWVFISLTIPNTQPLEEIEAMLDRELPEISKKIPTIISGPFYFGIDNIGYHRLTISMGAECRQQDYNRTKSLLNHELWDIFEKNGIRL